MTAAVTADQVKGLRERTGAGMMDCKRALSESGGDEEGAIRILRERGIASAGKRADRATKEGVVLTRVSGPRGAIVAVGCETEPVASNTEFQAFARHALEAVERGGPAAVSEVEAERTQLVAKIGENIVLRGVERYEASAGAGITEYVHQPARKIGVLVEWSGNASAEMMQEVAMQIAWANPMCLDRSGAPAERVAEEKAILEKQVDPKKPPQIREKILEGKLGAFYEQVCLLEQAYIREPKKKVKDILGGAQIRRYVRFALGE